jgi:dihydropteroate synthase
MSVYYRPIVDTDPTRVGLPLSGGPLYFRRLERLERERASEVVPIAEVPTDVLELISQRRTPMGALSFQSPMLMGVLNVTPDSFSDGGKFISPENALVQAQEMVSSGVAILDIGGESTRPGAALVEPDVETSRVVPVIEAIRALGIEAPISIDTRKSNVAQAALDAGANILNDVSAMTFDNDYSTVAANANVPLCLMHAQGDPKTMQESPRYEDVLLDVYDHLEERVKAAVAAGVLSQNIIVDPGIGFGKTQEDNLSLLRRISLFHSLGCPILLGVSRKRFVGTIGQQPDAAKRGPGSAAIGWEALSQGVQILRVHDIDAHRQMLGLWQAIIGRT